MERTTAQIYLKVMTIVTVHMQRPKLADIFHVHIYFRFVRTPAEIVGTTHVLK